MATMNIRAAMKSVQLVSEEREVLQDVERIPKKRWLKT